MISGNIKKRITFLREYKEERAEAQPNSYRLLLKMWDSSKSNGIKSLGFHPCLQQKARHCTPPSVWVSVKLKPQSNQGARNKLFHAGLAFQWLQKEPPGTREPLGLKAKSHDVEQAPDSQGEGCQGYTTGQPWPIWRKRSQELLRH